MLIDNKGHCTAFFFDIDGTLIDSGGAGGGALLAAVTDEFEVTVTRQVSLHGRTDLGIMTELLNSCGVPVNRENIGRLSRRYFELLPESLRSRDGRVLPGVPPLLSQLTSLEHCHLGLLTGNMPSSAKSKLEHFGLWDVFSFGVFGDGTVERRDLSRPAFERLEEHLDASLPPEQIVLIGDTPLDVELAQVMGVRCLAVCTGGFSSNELRSAGADRVVENLLDTDSILEWCLAPQQEELR